MKTIKKILNRWNESATLADSVEGLIEYVVRQVAALQNRVVQLSRTDHAGDIIPKSRAEYDALNDSPVKLNSIPGHIHKGNKSEKRRFSFFVTLLILCESALTFYALTLMIARGDNAAGWVTLRVALALVTTAISVLAAEEFFKIYFKDKERQICEQYDISNGNIGTGVDDPGLDKSEKALKRRNLTSMERHIWFALMLLGNMVIVLFALIRSKSIETSTSLVQTAGLVILSGILPVIGGLLYSKVKLLSFMIRAYTEQGQHLEKIKKLRRTLNELPISIAEKYNHVLFEECARVFENIKFFEAQINQRNFRLKRPKASRAGIGFIADFNTFLRHIELHTRGLVLMVTQNSNNSVRTQFENRPSPEGLYHTNHQPEETPKDTPKPVDPYTESLGGQMAEPTPDLSPKPVNGANGHQTNQINFNRN